METFNVIIKCYSTCRTRFAKPVFALSWGRMTSDLYQVDEYTEKRDLGRASTSRKNVLTLFDE